MAKQSNSARNATRRLRYLLTHPPKEKQTKEEKLEKRRISYAEKHPKISQNVEPPYKEVQRGPITRADIITISPPETYEYVSPYTHRLTYLTVNKQGVKTRHYFNIPSDTILPKYKLIDEVWEKCGQGKYISQYESTKCIKSSIQLMDVMYNPNA